MNCARMQKRRAPGSLKQAVGDLITAAGGIKVSARASKTTLAEYSDEAHPRRHMPVDVVLDLEKRAGEPIVTRFLLLEQGWLAVRLPQGAAEPYALALARIQTRDGELLSAGAMAIREGRVSCAEAQLLKERALQMAAACASLISDCESYLTKEGT